MNFFTLQYYIWNIILKMREKCISLFTYLFNRSVVVEHDLAVLDQERAHSL